MAAAMAPVLAPTQQHPSQPSPTTARHLWQGYSRSSKNPALQQLQKSSKSASTTPQRPIWNTAGTVAVWDSSESSCIYLAKAADVNRSA